MITTSISKKYIYLDHEEIVFLWIGTKYLLKVLFVCISPCKIYNELCIIILFFEIAWAMLYTGFEIFLRICRCFSIILLSSLYWSSKLFYISFPIISIILYFFSHHQHYFIFLFPSLALFCQMFWHVQFLWAVQFQKYRCRSWFRPHLGLTQSKIAESFIFISHSLNGF